MSSKCYPEEFKIEAVKQVVDRGCSVSDVARRLDVTTHSLYAWIKKSGPDSEGHNKQAESQIEIRRLQKELKRVTEEQDILKKPRRTSRKSPTEVRLYPGQQPVRINTAVLSVTQFAPEWLQCLAQAAKLESI